MNNEEKLVKIHRNDFYKKVWKTPMSRLASEYGISDVGLAKICKKLNVPRPSRGYWTKLQFGKQVSRSPLPAIGSNERAIYEIYGVPKDKRKFRKEDIEIDNALLRKKSKKEFNVSKRLMSPHPLVKSTKQILSHQKADDYGILHSWGNKGLDIRVSPKSINRALRIMDAIIKVFKSIGNKVMIDDDETHCSSTYVETRGTKIPFYIKEKIRRMDHIPTEKEIKKQKEWHYDKPRCWDYISTGKLSLKIDAWEDSRARKDGRIPHQKG